MGQVQVMAPTQLLVLLLPYMGLPQFVLLA
jgi:hypothetical protein